MPIAYILVNRLSEEHKLQLLEFYENEWWSKGRTEKDVEIILENSSLLFGFIDNDSKRLIGFARVLSDFYKYAHIYDVIIDPTYRGSGLGKEMLASILNHPKLNDLKNFELTCVDELVPFYEKFGFSTNYSPTVPLRRTNLNVTKN